MTPVLYPEERCRILPWKVMMMSTWSHQFPDKVHQSHRFWRAKNLWRYLVAGMLVKGPRFHRLREIGNEMTVSNISLSNWNQTSLLPQQQRQHCLPDSSHQPRAICVFHTFCLSDWRLRRPCLHIPRRRSWRLRASRLPIPSPAKVVLWNQLSFTGHQEWTAELLARSQGLPLSVCLTLREGYPPSETIDLVLSALPRIRILRMTVFSWPSDRTMPLLSGPAPILESLTVGIRTGVMSSQLETLNDLLCHPESCELRRLTITNCPVSWPTISSCALTHIRLHTYHEDKLSLRDFLSCLSRFPLLRSIEASGKFKYDLENRRLASSILLPHLQNLALQLTHLSILTAIFFLQTLNAPSLSQLHLTWVDGGSATDYADLFASIATTAATRSPLLTLAIVREGMSYQSASIRLYADACDVASGPTESSVLAWMAMHTPVIDVSGREMLDPLSLAAFCNCLPVGGIRSLIYQHSLPSHEIWRDFARHLPSVTDLYMVKIVPIELLPVMLTASSEGDDNLVGRQPTSYVLPGLRTLMLEAVQFRWPRKPTMRRRWQITTFIASLTQSLIERLQGGVGLDRLRILHPNDMSQPIVDKLSEAIPLVEWDGVLGPPGINF